MNYQLVRTSYESSGIYGKLINANGEQIAITVEYPYPSGGNFISKLGPGNYPCNPSPVILDYGDAFQTFFITNIPNNVGMRFGMGSTPIDGTIVLGTERVGNQLLGTKCAFDEFVGELVPAVTLFYLTVT